MKYYLMSVFVFLGLMGDVRANDYALSSGLSDMEKISMIATLEDDILILETEIKKCEKSKKGWIAATVVGSAGVVATGVAAGVQGAKIANTKDKIEKENAEVAKKQAELSKLLEGEK